MKNISPLAGLLVCLALTLAFPSAALGQNGSTIVTFNPQNPVISMDAASDVGVEIQNVSDLYAFDIHLTFDPASVVIVDADPSVPGIQVAQGTFLDSGMVVKNEVDLEKGTIRYAMTQLNPSPARSGNGLLLVLRLQGKQVKQSALTIDNVQLATRAGTEIKAQTIPGSITVTQATLPGSTATSLPTTGPQVQFTQSPGGPQVTETPAQSDTAPASTPIPTLVAPVVTQPAIQNTASAEITAIPTATSSSAALQEATPTQPEAQVDSSPAPDAATIPQSGDNWVIIIVAALIVIGLFFIWLRTRRP